MIELLMILGLIFSAGFLVLMVSRRAGVPVVPGLIITGLFLSSFVDAESLSEILVLGISFLVFYIGLRTDLDGFMKVSSSALGISLVQIIATFAAVFAVSNYIGFQLMESLYIALAGSIASTLAGTDIFDQKLRMDLHHGQISTAANFIHDVVAVILISGLAAGLSTQGLNSMGITVLLLLTAFAFRELLSKKFHSLLRTEEIKSIVTVALYAFAVGLAGFIDVSPVATAFAVGLAISRGSETEEILDVLEPLKDFFAVILFVGLGSLIASPSTEVLIIAGVISAAALIFRPLIVSLVMLVTGHGGRKSFKTSLNMIQVSEFTLAAVLIAWISLGIGDAILEALILSMALTMIVSVFLARHSDILYEKLGLPLMKIEEFLENDLSPTELEGHVIVVGFDERGQKVAEILEEMDKEFLVVDYNIENIERAQIENIEHIFGDILDDKTLEAANISEADKMIVTSDHRPVIDKTRELKIRKVLMVRTEKEAEQLESENTDVIIEEHVVEEGLKDKILVLVSKEED